MKRLRHVLASTAAVGAIILSAVVAPGVASAAEGDVIAGSVSVSQTSITVKPYSAIPVTVSMPGCGRDVYVELWDEGRWREKDSVFLYDPTTSADCISTSETVDLNAAVGDYDDLPAGTYKIRFRTDEEDDYYGPDYDYVTYTEAYSSTITVKVEKGKTTFAGWPSGTWYVKKGADMREVTLRVGWPGLGSGVELQHLEGKRWEAVGWKNATYPDVVTTTVTAQDLYASASMRLKVAGDEYVTGGVTKPLTLKIGNAPSVKASLNRSAQVYGKGAARLTVSVGSKASGTALIVSGSQNLGSVKVKDGKGAITLPASMKVGSHLVSVRFLPKDTKKFKSTLGPTLSLTVKKS